MARIVIGNPKTVPAGQYAEESLRALGLWDRVRPKLVFAENVRQALDYVARGEVDAGFVYTTDAATRAQGVKEAFRPPEDTYRPIAYPGRRRGGVAASHARARRSSICCWAREGQDRARPFRLPAAPGRARDAPGLFDAGARRASPCRPSGRSGHGILPGQRVDPS